MKPHFCYLAMLLLFSRCVAHQAPLSMRFSRQKYCSGLPFPSPGDLHDPGIEPMSAALAGRFSTTEPTGKPLSSYTSHELLIPKCCKLWLMRVPAKKNSFFLFFYSEKYRIYSLIHLTILFSSTILGTKIYYDGSRSWELMKEYWRVPKRGSISYLTS